MRRNFTTTSGGLSDGDEAKLADSRREENLLEYSMEHFIKHRKQLLAVKPA